jgi:NAD-dependent dihydropyrimidine dehydrogenase PreA subunit
MSRLSEHPTVKRHREKAIAHVPAASILDASWLRDVALEAGADDVGFVGVDRPEIATEREDIFSLLPATRTLLSFVCRMNRENVRSPARSLANLEFHHTGDQVNDVARRIVSALERRGVRAVNPAMGFPMEMDRFPEKIWTVSHKPIAVAAGLGHMGIHRNVIHPVFGNFILLGTVLIAAEVSAESEVLDYNPCLDCKLCVAACPVGAISADGRFDFSACYTHNYREFMGGFTSWVESIAASRTPLDYRARVSDSESASMWQSLSFGANYKAAYCMSVCPAGEEVIEPFLKDRGAYLSTVVKPLQGKSETIFVLADSDAESHVGRRFPAKKTKRVSSGLRPRTLGSFLRGLSLTFQRERSKGIDATYHFSFHGAEERHVTIRIQNQTLEVDDGHVGTPDLRVAADRDTWLGFVARERNLVWALLRRKIRLKGSPRHLLAFGRCFPS